MNTSGSELKHSIFRSLTWHLTTAFAFSMITALIAGYITLATGTGVMESLKNICETFLQVATLCIAVLVIIWTVKVAVILKS
ncbi:hypothetical protein SAZ11_19040 [Streptomyces sp. FXJ1.4098]|nr:hypothetical protein [Streptomyces sp. FXJ1.4098]